VSNRLAQATSLTCCSTQTGGLRAEREVAPGAACVQASGLAVDWCPHVLGGIDGDAVDAALSRLTLLC